MTRKPLLSKCDCCKQAKLRSAVQPLVIDCRLCKHVNIDSRGVHCFDPCNGGDMFERAEFVPLWRTEP